MANTENPGEQPQAPIGNGKEKVAPQDAAAGSSSTTQATAHTVAAIVKGAKDGRGEPIEYVYFKREDYAIYRSGPQIPVAYADAKTTADEQIARISGLLPLRDHLINLTRDLPQRATEKYLAQIADALRLGLEKQSDVAKAIIDEAMHNAMDAQARIGRMVYLSWAAGMALGFAIVLILIGGAYVIDDQKGVHLLLMATGAGAVGALLSIAIGIRGRTVAIDGNWKANAMDALVRVLIGIISAAVLFLLLSSGILTGLQAGTVELTGAKIEWQAALLIGFAAGFLERLVPDLLEKSAPASPPAASPPPTSGGGVVSPSGGNAGKQ